MVQTENLPANDRPDWTIEELYKKAWKIVKKQKVLWIFGAAIGAGFNFSNIFRSSGDNNWLQDLFKESPKNSSEIAHVLGSATSTTQDVIFYILSKVPPFFYIILGLEALILLVIGIIISVVYKGWATAALLEAIEQSIAGGKVSIRETSEKAFRSIGSMIWLEYVPGIIFMLISIVLFIVLSSIIAFGPGLLKLLSGLSMLVFFIAAFYAFILLSLTGIWAQRQVIVHHISAKKAFLASYEIVKKKKWSMILLGIVNFITTMLVFGLPLVIAVAIFTALLIKNMNSTPNSIILSLFIPAAILLLFLLVAFTVGGAMLNAFKAVVWSLAYNVIKGKYEKK